MAIIEYETKKRGTMYAVKYYDNGKQRLKRGFPRKIDAKKWEAVHVTAAKATGTYTNPTSGKITVSQLSAQYFDTKKITVKPSYFEDISAAYHNWVDPEFGHMQVAKITHSQVQAWANSIAEQRSASVVRRAKDILSGILDIAVKDNIIAKNPADDTIMPRKKQSPHRYLTINELYKLADNAGNRHDTILILGLCGMRIGELMALTAGDVDVTGRRISITKNQSIVSGKKLIVETKTYQNRVIMYPDVLDDIINAHIANKSQSEPLIGVIHTDSGDIQEPTSVSSTMWINKAMSKAGLDGHITVHDLRHTAASIMVQSGANVKAIQRQLGHKNASTTLDIYADLFTDDLDLLSEHMGDLIKNKLG